MVPRTKAVRDATSVNEDVSRIPRQNKNTTNILAGNIKRMFEMSLDLEARL